MLYNTLSIKGIHESILIVKSENKVKKKKKEQWAKALLYILSPPKKIKVMIKTSNFAIINVILDLGSDPQKYLIYWLNVCEERNINYTGK